MRLYPIGVGGAGCRVVDRMYEMAADRALISGVACFDTDATSLDGLASIPSDRRYRYGERAGNSGLAGNIDRGVEIGTTHAPELCRELDAGQPTQADAFLLVAGLGGATGGGTLPALVRELEQRYAQPAYVVGILPKTNPATTANPEDQKRQQPSETHSTTAQHSDIASLTAAVHALDQLQRTASAIIGFENGMWLRPGETLPTAGDRLNRELARRLIATFEDPDTDGTAEQVVDAADIARVLGDDGEFAVIGHAQQRVRDGGSRFGLGLFASTEEVDTSTAIQAVETVIHKAARHKQTASTGENTPQRGLLIVGGPPAWLIRRAVADGRRWVADELGTQSLVSGDRPKDNGTVVAATILQAGYESLPSIKTLHKTVAEGNHPDGEQ